MARPCKFGQNCRRPDCFFEHPGDGQRSDDDRTHNGYSTNKKTYWRDSYERPRIDHDRNREPTQYRDPPQFRDQNRSRDSEDYIRTRPQYKDPSHYDYGRNRDQPQYNDHGRNRDTSQFNDYGRNRDTSQFNSYGRNRDPSRNDYGRNRDPPQYRDHSRSRDTRDQSQYRDNHSREQSQFRDHGRNRDNGDHSRNRDTRDSYTNKTHLNVRTSLLDPPRYIFTSFNVPPYNTWSFHNLHPDELRLFYYEQRHRVSDNERGLLDQWYRQLYQQAYNHNYELFCRAVETLPEGSISTSRRKVDLRRVQVFDTPFGDSARSNYDMDYKDISTSTNHYRISDNTSSTNYHIDSTGMNATQPGINTVPFTNYSDNNQHMNSTGYYIGTNTAGTIPFTNYGDTNPLISDNCDISARTIPFTNYGDTNPLISNSGTKHNMDTPSNIITNPIQNHSSTDSFGFTDSNRMDHNEKTPEYTFGNIPYDREDTYKK